MKIKTAEFVVSAPDLRSCPDWGLPEIALIGRSNVGKSSLVNLLTGRRDLAKVSGTPGKTKLINFFLINDAWSLVDLPGYGYAQVGRERRLDFAATVAGFLSNREALRCVFVLIDSRLPPQPIDLDFLQWLAARRVSSALIFTKADKQSTSQQHASIQRFKTSLAGMRLPVPDMLVSSATTGAGRTEILGYIADMLANARGAQHEG